MPITYDITKDSFYLEGVNKGISNMLKKGFDIKTISEIMEVTQKYVKQIQKELEDKE